VCAWISPRRERERICRAIPGRMRGGIHRRFSLLLFGFLIETFRNDEQEGDRDIQG